MNRPLLLAIALLAPCFAVLSQESASTNYMKELKAFEAKLKFKTGEVSLKDDLAKLRLPEGFRYLSPEDAETVLVKIWGNPPDTQTLGMIVPPDVSLIETNGWAIVLQFQEDGYVKDEDADKINYTKLLKDMQKASKEENEERQKEGYPTVELVGWAAPPRYDKASHKMYWAKELKFSDSKENTLNYGIRVLGRRGVLVLNAVASMSNFPMIEQQTPEIVKMVEFNEGHRYADFNGNTDKVAAYGLAALVAGGVAAKAGFFKVIIAALIAAKKFVIIGVVAVAAFLKKLFSKKGE